MKKIDKNTEITVRRFFDIISPHYDIADIIIYGSRARGTHNIDSDADVAIILKGIPDNFMSIKFEMSDIAFDILLETGILISPLPIWTSEWSDPENHKNPSLLHNIAIDGIHL